MDHAVLEAVARELERHLVGRPLSDVAQLDSHRFLLRFDGPPFPRVHVGIHPRLSVIHLARGIKVPSSTTRLAVDLTRELEGRRVTALAKVPSDRLLRIEFERQRTLVLELMGKASNLLLLDGKSRIIRFARTHRGAFRRPREGDRYEPPPPRPGRIVEGPSDLSESQLQSLVDRPGDPAEAARGMIQAVPGLSVRIAREVVHRRGLGDDPWEVFQALIREPRRDPILYTPVEASLLEEVEELTPANLFPFIFPLTHAAGLVATHFATINEALETASRYLVRHLEYCSVRNPLVAMITRERRRVVDLIATLERELAEAEQAGERDRRWAELILAGLHDASRHGSVVRVKNHYDPAAPMLEIPIDPRLDLKANAQRYFKSSRRSQRTRRMIPGRLDALRRTAAELGAAAGRLEEAGTLAAVQSLERDLQGRGIVRAYRKAQRTAIGGRAEYVPVREYTTREGFRVLVGRSSADNDHLTFKVAAPHDLWLHAAGYAGAHVIVRNPKRLPVIPDPTIRQAAAIAAHFSKGREEKQIDVHVAWRRHVRKGRGMSAGMVMLKRHRSVRVTPGLPARREGIR